MKIVLYTVLSLFISLYLPLVTLQAQEQCDFDDDGISDYTYLTTNGTSYVWNTDLSSSIGSTETNTFGLTSDQISLGHWLDSGTMSLGIVRLNAKKTKLIWKIFLDSGLLAEADFGNADSVYLSGGDFDGNGITDAAVVERSGSGLKWTVKLNMFSDADKKTVKFRFGKTGDRVLFLNPEGEKDWAGVFGKNDRGQAVLTLRNLTTKKTITVKKINKAFLSGGNSRPRPFPIKSEDGTDVIGFLAPRSDDPADSRLTVYDLTGSEIGKFPLSGTGTFAVGNYDPEDEGEEVIFQTSGALFIINPFSGTSTKDDAFGNTLIDEINIENIHAPTPVPTATPEATATATATAEPTP